MATYDDIKDDIKAYWQQVWDTLKVIIGELDKGKPADSPSLNKIYENMRPLTPGDFACSLCDRTKEAYNLVKGTTHSQTFENMCKFEDCIALQTCRYDPRKWQCFQCFACIWYFREGQYFKNEGNRYPLCQRTCQNFTYCEANVPTDTVDFSDLSQEDKVAKLEICLYTLYAHCIADNWVDDYLTTFGVSING